MKLCMGCMSEIEDRLTICPYCGFNEAALQQESYYLTPGMVVGGKYIVGKVLRYGGHTISYLGMDAEVNRKVVVKEYLPSDFSTRSEGEQEITIYSGDAKTQFEQGLTSFLNEANKLQSLGSTEGIAGVYDCVAENDTGYVIEEYMEGRTLKEILASGKRYSIGEAVTLLSPILRGLERVHAMHMIHCDISPETIMVTGKGEAKLVDFGATRYVTTANSKSLTIILKQGYAPEEQYRSSGNRGSWTDVYAVGAVMYRMITGRTPQESVERALVDELKEPSKLGVSIPANVENALMNALNVYQKERTATVGAFLQELNAPSVKRIKAAKKKKETGKFPVWAKGLVAVLLCITVIGGFRVYSGLSVKTVFSDESGKSQLVDFKGKTKADVEEWRQQNKNDLPKDFKIEIGYMYSKEKDDDVIVDQSIESGTRLDELDENNHTLIVYLASKTKTSCHDIVDSQMNFVLLEEKLPLDLDSKGESTSVSSKDGKTPDFKICSIELDNPQKKLTADEIEKNSEIEIEISNIKKIIYYLGEFFCWGDENQEHCMKLENYETMNIKDIQAPVYKKDKKQKDKYSYNGEKPLAVSDQVDNNYYTYHRDWTEGYICKQTYTEEKLDLGKTEDVQKLGKEKLFYVIKESICYETGESLSDFYDRLKKYTFSSVEYWKDGKKYEGDLENMELDEGNIVVVDEDDNEKPYFKKEEMEKLTYRIAVKEKPMPSTQKSEPASKTSGGGSTTKGVDGVGNWGK